MSGTSIQPVYLLADSQLLFESDRGRSVVTSILEASEGDALSAAYVGAANGDDRAHYSIFQAAMKAGGVTDCRMISSEFYERDEAYLRGADIILLAGGDVARGWQVMHETGMARVIVESHQGNAALIGVSAGAVLLGLKGWTSEDPDANQIFDAFMVVPYVVDAHDEAHDWARLKKVISQPGSHGRGVALPAGSGIIYHADNSLEPVRRPIVELIMRDEEMVRTILFPPDAGEGPPTPA